MYRRADSHDLCSGDVPDLAAGVQTPLLHQCNFPVTAEKIPCFLKKIPCLLEKIPC
jgi:hypothetical protein